MTGGDLVARAGDVVGSYRLLEDFRVVGAGLSEWSFAERDGREYFIKRFLSPTYPDDAAPGSARTKAAKRARCAAFEAHHRGIRTALAPVTSYGGNLIATLDFFRHGAKYYKVTEKVDIAGLGASEVARLDFPARLVLLKTVAHSLKILHDLAIVHSDLKPSNVLIKRTELGYTTKLIDFDSSYIVGSPPPPEEIVGTMDYYSPELVRYIQGSGDASELTTKSDIFALGLIYAEYLTGAPPAFDPAHHEAAIAVLHGTVLRLPPTDLPGPVVALVERMLLADPATRPSVGEIHAALMGLRADGPSPSSSVLRTSPSVRRSAPPSGLRTAPSRTAPSRTAPSRTAPSRTAPSGRRTPTPAATAAPAPPARSGPPSTLRGKGLRLTERARSALDGPARGGPAPTGPAPRGPAPTGPAADRPASTGPVAGGPAAGGPAPGRGRALLGKLVGKLEERLSR